MALSNYLRRSCTSDIAGYSGIQRENRVFIFILYPVIRTVGLQSAVVLHQKHHSKMIGVEGLSDDLGYLFDERIFTGRFGVRFRIKKLEKKRIFIIIAKICTLVKMVLEQIQY